MENYQKYRDELASHLKKASKAERKLILEREKKSKKYQRADIYSIERRYRNSLQEQYQKWKKNEIILDIENPPQVFQGVTGKYKIEKFSEIILDSIVSDEEGRKFFLTPKMSERQAMSSLLGNYLIDNNPELKRLHFPEIRLEQINNEVVAFMEYFDDYHEISWEDEKKKKEIKIFSEEEKAFMEIYNLWIGNWDFKNCHVMYSKCCAKNNFIIDFFKRKRGDIGLIDLEKSFDFYNKRRIDQTVLKSVFLDSKISEESNKNILTLINKLNIMDRNKIIKFAVDSGFEPEETINIIFELFKRREKLEDEVKYIRKLYLDRKNISVLDW